MAAISPVELALGVAAVGRLTLLCCGLVGSESAGGDNATDHVARPQAPRFLV